MTNWYVRLNRNRLKGDHGNEEWLTGLNVLYESILKVTVLMAPFTPFVTEMIYQNMKKCLPEDHPLSQQSIHFLTMPTFDETLVNPAIDDAVRRM
jgi:isoleucyl-tRNA synthetase